MKEAIREASHYRADESGSLRCELCPRYCRIREGGVGACRSRRNENGVLRLMNYGRVVSVAIDPIEKKPLYHFYPGSGILSVGGMGCNLKCAFCQNWNIAHEEVPTHELTPEGLAAFATEKSSESIGVAFTYNEPMIWFEFIRDAAPMLRETGQKVVLVTNGYINPEPLEELLPLVDAMNIDLKSFRDDFYVEQCGGRVEPVKATIRRAVEAGVWVEVTCLLIPGLNDTNEELESMTEWIASVSADTPLHLSRYFPNYRMERPPTPPETLRRARDIAKKRLHYVYVGNIDDPDSSSTRCPECGEVVIERRGYRTNTTNNLTDDNHCAPCGAEIALVR